MTDDATRAEPKPPPVDRMSLLWQRINEHKIVQWSVAYVALAYAIQHAIILTSESYEWPNVVARTSMTLFVLGLPLVMLLAWYHGHHASRSVSRTEASIIALLFAVGSLWFYTFVKPHEQGAASTPQAQEAGLTQARRAATDPHGAISVAVLPFLDLSPAKDQEFFSDGMTEEITTALAKVPDLRVVGRTSAFQFKGQNKDLTAIGQALHATHLIEGSIRKAGNRLRITAQLIKSDDGTHIWAEDYDRDLTDVFAIQEDIARAITASLHMTLGLKPGENLVNARGIDLDSYQQYLRARGLILTRERGNVTKATDILEQLTSHVPNYAPAWAELTAAYYFMMNTAPERMRGSIDAFRRVADTYTPKMESAARRAVALDPNLADANAALAIVAAERHDYIDADKLARKALSLDANSPTVLNVAGGILGAAARLDEAAVSMRQLRLLEPFVPVLNNIAADHLWAAGDAEAAMEILRPAAADGDARGADLAMYVAALGRYEEAATILEKTRPSGQVPAQLLREASSVLRGAVQAQRTAATDDLSTSTLSWVYLYSSMPQLALAYYEREIQGGYAGIARVVLLWHPSYAPARKTPRFKKLVKDFGLLDYWRAKGWPPQCHPTSGDDFACE